ncbi:Protein CBG25527 [Caenorhabditis briggsae]|uniref:Homeobox domain-containing protein n=2 Tax=Caenorhabditis briggsae TaxID=6238 RepID=A0AAE9IWF8_CAEBR|nr:Protein CBG25527 [Caenorhabditis briggsae]ULU08016.1 hypothetical protein L3Y34_019231 [Caenorhabditis briggsae]CAR98732.1 Protein CBG25527 [Caenorhabditis briggsae]
MPIELDAKTIHFLEAYFAIKQSPDTTELHYLRSLTGARFEDLNNWFKRRQILKQCNRPLVSQIHAARSDQEDPEPTLRELRDKQDQLMEQLLQVAAKVLEKQLGE